MTHLVVVSVPWRRSSLARLLTALAFQSQPPDRITLLLQRYPSLPRVPPTIAPITRVINLRSNTGPVVRWVWIERYCRNGEIACVLDDDFVPEPSYLEETTAPIREGWADATGWYGMDPHWNYYQATRKIDRPVPLRIIAGGACAMRAEFMRGLQRCPLADLLSTLDGGDDLLSSAVLRQNRARMVRPAGFGPLQSTEHQNDLRSIRMTRSADNGKLFFATEALLE